MRDFVVFFQEMTDLDHITELGKWPHLVSRTMTIISTATNPTLYLIFSNPFRKALFNACTCSWNIPEGMPSVSENASGDKPVFACCNCWRRHLRRVAPDSDSNKNEDALTDRRRRETQKEIIT